ncbi:hypothetical protein [Hymenobacter cellulosilyticus]|uniref:Uncharacterized protein n=1 Tax=Hymenobacter cellulosilyticus TaxID=2932248 RepID=A0A8T9Q2M7_9BACT|nr:hypothetical protein [Hymenobacter cellulosilyticus]UOQ70098.1 hypothetical protein MUN79_15105 [Hymenobacter cellulosilyticus]
MLSFDKIFGDWFADDAISFEELEAGTRDHLERLRQGNDQGRFTTLITATEARYEAYFGQRSQAGTARSSGKGSTLTLGTARQQLVDWLAGPGRDYVDYKLQDKAQRLRFYPNGSNEYHQADHPAWPGLLERFDKALAELGSKFEADFKTTYTQHRDALLAALKLQTGQKKAQADARVGTRAERDLLTRQLSRNARQLGLVFDEHPGQAATYFDKKYFNQHQPAAKAPAVKPVSPSLN